MRSRIFWLARRSAFPLTVALIAYVLLAHLTTFSGFVAGMCAFTAGRLAGVMHGHWHATRQARYAAAVAVAKENRLAEFYKAELAKTRRAHRANGGPKVIDMEASDNGT